MSHADERLDVAECLVEVGGEQFPFEVDLATGGARIRLGQSWRTVAPLSWREKMNLARYASGRSVLVDRALVQHRLGGPEVDSSEAGSHGGRALVLLARWLNGFAAEGATGRAAVLEPGILAAIETQALRSSGLAPTELDRLPALEVEQIAGAATPVDRAPTEMTADQPGNAAADAADRLTRILVVPDPDRAVRGESTRPSTGSPPEAPSDKPPAGASRPLPEVPPGSPPHPGKLALIRADAAAPSDLPYLAEVGPAPVTAAGRAPAQVPAGVPAPLTVPVTAFAEPAEPLVPQRVERSDGHRLPAGSPPRPWGPPAAPLPWAGRRPAATRSELAAPPNEPSAFPVPLTAPVPGRAAASAALRPTARPPGPTSRIERTPRLGPSAPAPPAAAAAPRLADDQLEYVLGEFARRLEQAVFDLGLDPED